MLNRYYDDWMKTSLQSKVIDRIKEERGYWIACEESVFYVEGGGMASDRGTLNDLTVKALKWENGHIYHLVEEPLEGVVTQQVDVAYRRIKTQIHSAQHLMCGIMNKRYHAPTISFFNDAVEAGAEMGFTAFDHALMEELEQLCNAYICMDLPVEIVYPTKEEALRHVALEKTDHEELRAVKIGDIDYNMCGCVQVPSLRHIQMIKFQRFEKTTRGYRIYFLCGDQLLHTYGKQLEALSSCAKKLAVPLLESAAGVDRLQNELKAANQEEQNWKNQYVELYAKQMAETHQEPLIVAEIDDLDTKMFTSLCSILVRNYEKSLLCVCHHEARAHVVIAHAPSMTFKANALFQQVGKRFAFKGGGSPFMAQGGGAYEAGILAYLQELAKDLT